MNELSVKIIFYDIKLNVNIFKSLPNDLKHIVYSTIVYLNHKVLKKWMKKKKQLRHLFLTFIQCREKKVQMAKYSFSRKLE